MGFFFEHHRACLIAMCYQQEKGRDGFESFFPTCSNSTIRLVLALTAVNGRLVCGGFVCAFISIDLALGERVCMEGPTA